MTILVVAEHTKGKLSKTTLASVAAAKQLGGEIKVLVAGKQVAEIAQQASLIQGVSEVLLAQDSSLENLLTADLAALIEPQAKHYSHILFATSSLGKSTAPYLAAKLNVAPLSDIVSILSAQEFVQPIYTGSVLAQVKTLEPIKILTVRSSAFEPELNTQAACSVNNLTVELKANPVKYLKAIPSTSDLPDLTSADIVVSGGKALASKENFEALIFPLAKALKAAIGASRAAVDAEFVPNDWQVGQTGKIVAPKLYIAIGISGAIQHLAGMKDAKTIVAINHDPEAPIFNVADYALVADLNEVVPQLIKELS